MLGTDDLDGIGGKRATRNLDNLERDGVGTGAAGAGTVQGVRISSSRDVGKALGAAGGFAAAPVAGSGAGISVGGSPGEGEGSGNFQRGAEGIHAVDAQVNRGGGRRGRGASAAAATTAIVAAAGTTVVIKLCSPTALIIRALLAKTVTDATAENTV